MKPRPGRGWTLFTAIGLPLWVGATVLAAVLNDDASNPEPVVAVFVTGGALFFGLMFGAALVQQLRMRAESEDARFGKRVAVGYSVTGAVVTALGLAAVWRGAIHGENVSIFLVPLVAIVIVWAVAAILILRHYRV